MTSKLLFIANIFLSWTFLQSFSSPLPTDIKNGITPVVVNPISGNQQQGPCHPPEYNESSQTYNYNSFSSADTCHEMEAKLNNAIPANKSPCPWTYKCNYKENRFPQYIINAQCTNSTCSGCSQGQVASCAPIKVLVRVYICPSELKIQSGSQIGNYEVDQGWKEIEVNVGCMCESKQLEIETGN